MQLILTALEWFLPLIVIVLMLYHVMRAINVKKRVVPAIRSNTTTISKKISTTNIETPFTQNQTSTKKKNIK